MSDLKQIITRKFYNVVRQYTRPKTLDEIEDKRAFWSRVYAGTSFVILIISTGLVAFSPKDNSQIFPKPTIIGNNMQVIKFEGFKKVGEEAFTRNEDSKKWVKLEENDLSKETKDKRNIKC